MNCTNTFLYTIKHGDILYQIARTYSTTVEEIMRLNPHVDPYNLQPGMQIYVCPSTIYSLNMSGSMPDDIYNRNMTSDISQLLIEMNRLWMEHILWTRLFLISLAEDLKDLEPTTKRLLQNPKDIGNLYREYYNDTVGNRISNLLTEHLLIGGDIIKALKNRDTKAVTELDRKWHQNADEIAETFSSINPYYDKEKVRKMMYDHLELTTNEVKARIARDYPADIVAYDKVEREVLEMARYFAEGIAKHMGL